MAELTHTPNRGMLTFNSEGDNDPASRYFSRRAHHPSKGSGATIGRGYDMLHRTAKTVIADLVAAGVPESDATALSGGAGLSGKTADAFVKRDDIRAIELSEEAQKNLFETVYAAYWGDARRICTKRDVQAKYGACDWDSMDSEIRELITDLLYRGDYTGATRTKIQKALLAGDLRAIKAALASLTGVPTDRKRRREQHLEKTALRRTDSIRAWMNWTGRFYGAQY